MHKSDALSVTTIYSYFHPEFRAHISCLACERQLFLYMTEFELSQYFINWTSISSLDN